MVKTGNEFDLMCSKVRGTKRNKHQRHRKIREKCSGTKALLSSANHSEVASNLFESLPDKVD